MDKEEEEIEEQEIEYLDQQLDSFIKESQNQSISEDHQNNGEVNDNQISGNKRKSDL